MRRAIVCLILTVLLWPQGSFAEETKQAEISVFDYSKYLAPKAWRAIQDGQGILHETMPSFAGPKTGLMQALVVDAKLGLLLSVAHGISEYPQVAFGKDTRYTFIYRGHEYPAELVTFAPIADLAIFKIKGGDIAKLKAVKFAKKLKPMTEFYSLNQYAKSSVDGFVITDNFPWKAFLVSVRVEITTIQLNFLVSSDVSVEYLTFDKSIIYGFSGSGVFNDRGEVIGMLRRSLAPGGYAEAVSVNTMAEFVRDAMNSLREKAKQEQAMKRNLAPVNKPNKK